MVLETHCAEETAEEFHKLIAGKESDVENEKRIQRENHSGTLLRKEIEAVKDKPADYLAKVTQRHFNI